MSKQAKKTEVTKPEARAIASEHAERVSAAEQAAVQAEARVGRGLIELLGLAQGAARARANVSATLTKAAISIGIDPDGSDRWNYDPARREFVKEG